MQCFKRVNIPRLTFFVSFHSFCSEYLWNVSKSKHWLSTYISECYKRPPATNDSRHYIHTYICSRSSLFHFRLKEFYFLFSFFLHAYNICFFFCCCCLSFAKYVSTTCLVMFRSTDCNKPKTTIGNKVKFSVLTNDSLTAHTKASISPSVAAVAPTKKRSGNEMHAYRTRKKQNT